MKRFMFRLDPLLKYREYKERRKKLAVAQAKSDVLLCEQSIEETREQRQSAVVSMERSMSQGMDGDHLRQFSHYLSGLDTFCDAEKLRLQELLEELTHRQQELSAKSLDRKVLENLKSKQQEEYYSEMIRAEQKELDDTIILRQSRKS